MKINTQRFVKVITSLMVVFLVVALSVFPAFASEDGIYKPFDYQTGEVIMGENGFVTHKFAFDVPPLMRYYINNELQDDVPTTDEVNIAPPAGTMSVAVRTYPLGVSASNNKPWPAERGVIDVREFKQYAQFTLTAEFDIEWTFVYPPIGTITLRGIWYVYCYDDSGWYTGTITSTATSENIDITNGGTTGKHYISEGLLTLPEGTAYILPLCLTTCYTPPTNEESYFICRPKSFGLSLSYNYILENSSSMNTIKNLLGDVSSGIGDLNDKFDEMFNGNDEGNQMAQGSANNVGNSSADLKEIMAQLEQYEHIDQDWSRNYLANFLSSSGYLRLQDLISPILNWSQYVTILLTILALTNLSLILFGR